MREAPDTKKLALTGMLAALTFIGTSVIKLQTPTFGYIHLGDGFVLLSGFLLGPLYGGLSAGIGSALSDLLGGYPLWVPGTFIIKALTAATASYISRTLHYILKSPREPVIIPGAAGESVMIFGYFLYNILIVMITNGTLNSAAFSSAIAASAAEIPFNIVQGFAGIVLSILLVPVFRKFIPAQQ